MYGDSFAPQVIDPQNAAYNIPSKVVEDEDFPYRFAIVIEQGSRLGSVRGVSNWIARH